MMRVSPAVRSLLGRQGARLVKRGAFSPQEASESLETSLRELRTDYVDILLLHDCLLEDCSPELLGFLRDAVDAGKVRAFGVGTSVESAAAIASLAPEFATVLQFEHSVLRPAVQEVDPGGRRATITHGAIAGLARLRRHLVENREVRNDWAQELRADFGEDRLLATLMLQFAVRTNVRGPVLFSSIRRQNIIGAVAAISDEALAAKLDRFVQLTAASPALVGSTRIT
jgi:aryl-alcohol dehydrogenase-like predicted oxidoreductase